MSKQKASELGKSHAKPLSLLGLLKQKASELGKGHAKPLSLLGHVTTRGL